MPATTDLNQTDRIVGIATKSIPCFPLDELNSKSSGVSSRMISDIREACLETGFFYVDPGQDSSFVNRTLNVAREFFDIDDSDPRKTAIARGDDDFGWMPTFSEPAYQPGTVAHMESFDCGIENVRDLRTDDVWPDIPGFRADVTRCWSEFSAIGETVLQKLSLAFGLDADFLLSACSTQELSTLRLLHYPENQAGDCSHNVGISAHTDFECITLIYQTAPGLELRDVSGHWYDAPAHDSRIVVLLGDMLERWTNGSLQATGHRVRNTHFQRHSIVMFFAVNDDIEVKPLPDFVPRDSRPGYSPTRQREHIDTEVRRAMRNKTSDSTQPASP